MQLQKQKENNEVLPPRSVSDVSVSEIAWRLKEELDKYVVGNEDVKTAVITGLLTGFPTLLIGDPGTAKTYTIELLSRMIGGVKPEEVFIVLAHEAMTPEDIFGNVNMKKLREEGVVEYITEGFLPSAKIVFIDEIFKSNKVLAESLFRAINEKKFRNGSKEVSLPWVAFYSASNEVRINTQADRAFLDRFKIFATVLSPNLENIQDLHAVAERYYRVLTATRPTSVPVVTSYEEIKKIQDRILSEYTKYLSEDVVLEAVRQANLILGAIGQALKNPRAFGDSGVVRAYFRSMGGYLTLSERKFKSIMQVANALREMFDNSTITPVHTALAFYLTIPFTPELKDIISPIISSVIKSYFESNRPGNSSVDVKSLLNSISEIEKAIFTNEDLNELLGEISTYAINIISRKFPASSGNLIQDKVTLVSKFSDVLSDEYTTLEKLNKFIEAIYALEDITKKYSNNPEIVNLARSLFRHFAGTFNNKVDVDRIQSDMSAKLGDMYNKIKAEIERKFSEQMNPEVVEEYNKLIVGIQKFFPQFSAVLPQEQLSQNVKGKEEIMKKLDETVNEVRTKITDFIKMLEETKNVLSRMAK